MVEDGAIYKPETLVELVKSGLMTIEEAESYLTGALLCEFRAWLSDEIAKMWDCKECADRGFQTCDIECDVAWCSECIRYRLCEEKGTLLTKIVALIYPDEVHLYEVKKETFEELPSFIEDYDEAQEYARMIEAEGKLLKKLKWDYWINLALEP